MFVRQRELIAKPPFGAARINRSHPLARSLASAYLFNEGGGVKIYDATQLRHGSLNGSTVGFSSSPQGCVVNLNAYPDAVLLPGLIPVMNGSQFTLCLKWNLRSSSTQMMFGRHAASHGRVIDYNFNSANGLAFLDEGDANITNFAYSSHIGEWHQIAWTYDSGSHVTYLDAAQQTTASYIFGGAAVDEYLLGDITESLATNQQYEYAYFFSTALTAAEIASLYLNPYGMFQPISPVNQVFDFAFTGADLHLPSLVMAATTKYFILDATLPSLTISAGSAGTIALTLPSLLIASLSGLPKGDMNLTLPSLTSTGQTNMMGAMALTLPSLDHTGTARDGNFIGLMLPHLTISAHGEQPYIGELTQTLPRLTLEAAGQSTNPSHLAATLPSLSAALFSAGHAEISLPSPQLSAHGQAGVAGSMSLVLPSLVSSVHGLQEQKGAIAVTVPLLRGSLTVLEGQVGSLAANLSPLQWSASGHAGTLGSIEMVLPMPLLGISEFQSTNGDLAVTLPVLTVSALIESDPELGLVLNIDRSALTEYDHVPFNSLTKFGSVYLGAANDGIYLLSGTSDNGTPIQSTVRIPTTEFGTSLKKRIPTGFLGMRSDGFLEVSLYADERLVATDTLENLVSTQHGQRMKFGRGAKGRYWYLEIKNLEGADFDLDEIELNPEVLSRH